MSTSPLRLLRFVVLAAAFAAAGFTAGCHGTAYPTSTTWPLNGTVWKLVELNGAAVAANHLPSIVFDASASRVSGRAGVNDFNGSYQQTEGAMTFGPLAVTKMAGSERQMQVEQQFLAALGRVTAWRIEGNLLVLLADKQEVARLHGLPVGSPL